MATNVIKMNLLIERFAETLRRNQRTMTMANLINFSWRKVGGITFIRLGAFSLSFSVAADRQYKPVKGSQSPVIVAPLYCAPLNVAKI